MKKEPTLRIKQNTLVDLLSQSIRISLPIETSKEMILYCNLANIKLSTFVEGSIKDLLRHDRVFRKYVKDNPTAIDDIKLNTPPQNPPKTAK
jgi:hypothetical protein